MSTVIFKSLKSSSRLIKQLINPIKPKCISQTPTAMASINNVPKVDIDKSGVFKYILLNVHEKNATVEAPVTIVRGYARCNYHSDIYDEVQEALKPLDCEPLGGGRISHDPENKTLHIYGYSQGYGKADHEVAASLIKEKFPDYKITVSDEGY